MDWSPLPPELLHLISTKFSSISDLIHFRAVCNTWRASAVSLLPTQIPCFLLESDPGDTTLQFYSLTSGKTHNVHVPSCHDQTVLDLSNGYLLVQHLTNPVLSLLNPVTNSKVSLPFLQIRRPQLVWSSPDPTRTDGYTVCIFGNGWARNKLSAFWRHGETEWSTINNGSSRSCYHEGMYLVLSTVSKDLEIFDVATKTLREVVPPPPGEGPFSPPGALVYLVVSAGQVLRVLEHYDKYWPVDHQCRFDIHRLEFGADIKKPSWVKVSNIGDQVLFLNVVNGFSINASCFEGLKGDSIYFMKADAIIFDHLGRYYLARYDIETGMAEELPFPSVTGGAWFLPSLQYS